MDGGDEEEGDEDEEDEKEEEDEEEGKEEEMVPSTKYSRDESNLKCYHKFYSKCVPKVLP